MTIPTNPAPNEEWTNDATGITYVWDGSRWSVVPNEPVELPDYVLETVFEADQERQDTALDEFKEESDLNSYHLEILLKAIYLLNIRNKSKSKNKKKKTNHIKRKLIRKKFSYIKKLLKHRKLKRKRQKNQKINLKVLKVNSYSSILIDAMNKNIISSNPSSINLKFPNHLV